MLTFLQMSFANHLFEYIYPKRVVNTREQKYMAIDDRSYLIRLSSIQNAFLSVFVDLEPCVYHANINVHD